MSITLNKISARLSFEQWLYFHRLDPKKCSGKCGDQDLCCEDTHREQLEKEYRTQLYADGELLGLNSAKKGAA